MAIKKHFPLCMDHGQIDMVNKVCSQANMSQQRDSRLDWSLVCSRQALAVEQLLASSLINFNVYG